MPIYYKGEPHEFVEMVSFKVEMNPSPDAGGANNIYTESKQRNWITITPPELPETMGIPPDQFVSYIATCMEPLDVTIGAAIYDILRDPYLRQKIGLRVADSMAAIMLADGITQSHIDHTEDGEKYMRQIMQRLLEGGGLGFAGEVIEAIHDGRPLPAAQRIQVGVALLRGIVQILLVERAPRSRSLVEVHTYSVMHGLLGQEGMEKILGRDIPVGVLVPVTAAPKEKPEPISEELSRVMEEHEFRTSHPEITDEAFKEMKEEEQERLKYENATVPDWERALKFYNERKAAEAALIPPEVPIGKPKSARAKNKV